MHRQFPANALTEVELHCQKCGWNGKGSDAKHEHLFLTDALELYCPKCTQYFGFVSTADEAEE